MGERQKEYGLAVCSPYIGVFLEVPPRNICFYLIGLGLVTWSTYSHMQLGRIVFIWSQYHFECSYDSITKEEWKKMGKAIGEVPSVADTKGKEAEGQQNPDKSPKSSKWKNKWALISGLLFTSCSRRRG